MEAHAQATNGEGEHRRGWGAQGLRKGGREEVIVIAATGYPNLGKKTSGKDAIHMDTTPSGRNNKTPNISYSQCILGNKYSIHYNYYKYYM